MGKESFIKMSKTPITSSTAVRPQDYANSPVHYAVATGDHTTLTKVISSLPKLSDPTRIHTESESLAEERLAEQISALLDRRDNPLKETPLHLAVRLNDVVAARAIADAGANINLQNAAGWKPLQEAILRRCHAISRILVHHEQQGAWYKWRRRRPRQLAALRRMPDFYMEISFNFESIIPFVSKIAPSDTYKIWKRAGNLRADFSMTGYEGLNIKRANCSILFLNDDIDRDDIQQGSLLVLKHDKKQIYVASPSQYEKGATPLSDAEISRRCNRALVVRPGMEVSKAELIGCKNWRRQEKTGKVGEWKARVYEMHNVILNLRSRKVNESCSTAENQVAPPQTTESELSMSLRPMVWLTEEFPLKTEELHRLLGVLSKKLKSVRRMRDVLRTTFPPGTFPVKIAIPVVPTVRVVITFTKFVELQPIDEDFHTPPSSPRHLEEQSTRSDNRGYLSFSSPWLKGSSRKKTSSSSGEQVVDPFAIPSGYSLRKFDDKNRETK